MRVSLLIPALVGSVCLSAARGDDAAQQTAFFEKKIRPLLIDRCYDCHSEDAGEQQGGLLLDRSSGWLKGGETGKAVVPGAPEASLLIRAVRPDHEDLQMPPDDPLSAEDVKLLEEWVRQGAPGPAADLGDTEFSRLGDQEYLAGLATDHWSFQPVQNPELPDVAEPTWNRTAIDRLVFARLAEQGLTPSSPARPRTLIRRISYALTGLPPDAATVGRFVDEATADRQSAITRAVDELIDSPAFGEHLARMWLDVARYADTDSFYRPDTRTPHYFPWAFTYRDYVVEAFNTDKPFDQFIREQLAADLMGFKFGAPETAALGFLTVGPHANRNAIEALDDWIDVTTRGLMGLTAACARCHDHKYEPIPTADYYSLQGVFASIVRVKPLDEAGQPALQGYEQSESVLSDYAAKRAAIDKKIAAAGGKKARNNNRSVAQKIRETELAELLLFHPGAPIHTMVVRDRPRPIDAFVLHRGDPRNRGERVPRRFLRVLDPEQVPFSSTASGRLDLAERIVANENPLTARVFVNRVWGFLSGAYLVATPSDFGLQGTPPTHPDVLDWLASDFVRHGWSVKRLVRNIVMTRTWQQRSEYRADAAGLDPQNGWLWRMTRQRLSIEAIRDSMLAVSGQLDRTSRGRPAPLWGAEYTKRRTLYGYINRFNLDPTLRVFDFPTPMQTQPGRDESIVAPQALFTMNSPFVIDQARAITTLSEFVACETDEQRAAALFRIVFQREPAPPEVVRVVRFVERQARFFKTSGEQLPGRRNAMASPWPLVAQSLLMSNEFHYVD